jgi:hypothetical protein
MAVLALPGLALAVRLPARVTAPAGNVQDTPAPTQEAPKI